MQQSRKRTPEVLQVQRLGQVLLHPGVKGFLPVLRVGTGKQRHDEQHVEPMRGADDACHFQGREGTFTRFCALLTVFNPAQTQPRLRFNSKAAQLAAQPRSTAVLKQIR